MHDESRKHKLIDLNLSNICAFYSRNMFLSLFDYTLKCIKAWKLELFINIDDITFINL